MEMQQLRHLLAAIEYGNLGQASEQLNMTQSGLSRSIKNLEDAVGLPLLIRSSRGVTASQFGEMLIPYAKSIVNERGRAMDAMVQIRQGREGLINLGVTVNFSHYFIPDVVAEFADIRPNVDVHVHSGDFPTLMQSLQLAEIDFFFGLFAPDPDQQPAGIRMEPLFSSQSVVVCAKDHDLTSDRVEPAELAEQTWGLLDGRGFRETFGHYFTSRGLSIPRQAICTNSPALLRRAITQMKLLTIVPKQVVQRELDQNEVRVVNCEVPAGKTYAGMAFRQGGALPPAAKQFADHLRQVAKKMDVGIEA